MNKNDLKQIKVVIDVLLKKRLQAFATKDDLKAFATKDDLKAFATKDDLKAMKKELIDRMDEMEMDIIATVDKHKEDKIVVEDLEKRFEKLENHVF